MLWLIAAWAAPVYNTDEVDLGRMNVADADLFRQAEQDLAARGATWRGDGTRSASESLAIIVAASTPARGGEFDLRLRGDRVTLWEDNHTWITRRTPDVATSVPAPSMTQLAKEYPIGPISTEGNRRWEPQATSAIAAALARLTPAERAPLSEVRWVRRPRAASSMATRGGLHEATYIVDRLDTRIEVYDDAVLPSKRFVGPLDRPSTPATAVILHEIGHAIADAPMRTLARDYEAARIAHAKARDRQAAELATLNRSIAAYNRSPSPAKLTAIDTERVRLQTWAAQLNERAGELTQARNALQRTGSTSPMARLFAEEVGGSPTAYGRTTLDEAFAEAFALYHLDPDALQRAQPGALEWFKSGQHTRSP